MEEEERTDGQTDRKEERKKEDCSVWQNLCAHSYKTFFGRNLFSGAIS